ncbi:MAG: substrate-binding domain-containing protein [Hyphomicrobiales bacterium]|nr:substrate-binding domain-containing protein [Hyphomicrobiales bacterium]
MKRSNGTTGQNGDRKSRTTILDIARRVEVAPSTVSNALSGRRYVDPQIAERIRQVAAEEGYTPNSIARGLRSGRANAIGLLSSMPFGVAGGSSRLGFMMEIAAAAAAYALQRGLALLLVPPMEAGRPPLQNFMLDGALVVEPFAGDPFVQQLVDFSLPVVTIGKQPEGNDLPFVDLRSRETAEIVFDHLIASGARRIALLTGKTRRTSYIETKAVYAKRMAELGAPVNVVEVPEEGGEQAGYEAAKQLLAKDRSIDAIFSFVDAFATGTCRAIRDAGLRVPEDIKVATRYDGPRARDNDPPLTAVDLGLSAVAESAVKLLIDTIDGKLTGSRSLCAPPPKLMVRKSSV